MRTPAIPAGRFLACLFLAAAGCATSLQTSRPAGEVPRGSLSPQPEPADPVTADLPTDPESLRRGERLFKRHACNGCHGFGEYFGKCPDLKGVTSRRTPGWLREWLRDPEQMRQADSDARQLSEQYEAVMPFLGLSENDISDLMGYLATDGNRPESR
ncbi:MAG: cytochrome c [Deltaproteobacteria bacterium]|nr:cytochrome c [Deltaproteobacteria bacterium]